jgi:hypothetical protein
MPVADGIPDGFLMPVDVDAVDDEDDDPGVDTGVGTGLFGSI